MPINGTMAASVFGSSTFTISTFPADPYVGEIVRMNITGDGGHTVTSGRELPDIWVETSPGEAGSFRHVADPWDKIPGRVAGHAYKTAGSKTLTTSSWTWGAGVLVQDTIVSITDPDAETWDHTYWIDISTSPSMAGADAEDANNTHITTAAAYDALRSTYALNSKIRHRYRSGVTHIHTATSTHRSESAVLYCDVFGGTAQAVHDCTAGTGDMFAMETPGARLVWYNHECIGPYDPVEGYGNKRNFATNWDGDATDLVYSVTQCDFRGWRAVLSGGGPNYTMKGYRFGVFDSSIRDWQNYGLFCGNGEDVHVHGSVLAQHPLAGTREGKTGVIADWPDHGPIRCPHSSYMGITRSRFLSQNGWSTAFGIYIHQPAIRCYTEDNADKTEGSLCSIMQNDLMGGFAVEWGRQNDTADLSFANQLLLEGNRIEFGPQRGTVVAAEQGGVFVQNNVITKHALAHDATFNHMILRLSGRYGGSGVVNDTAWQNPCEVRNNIYLSNGTDATIGSAGDIQERVINAATTNASTDGDFEGASVATADNLLSGDGHSNAGSLVAKSAFSLGDLNRPITAGAADVSKTVGPPADYEMTRRTSPTNTGPYHATGANVAAPIIANTVPPVIRTSVYRANTLLIDDKGTWSNIATALPYTTDEGLFEVQWQLNGADYGNSQNHYKELEHGGTSGTYTAIITYDGRDGTRVSATSNSIVI